MVLMRPRGAFRWSGRVLRGAGRTLRGVGRVVMGLGRVFRESGRMLRGPGRVFSIIVISDRGVISVKTRSSYYKKLIFRLN